MSQIVAHVVGGQLLSGAVSSFTSHITQLGAAAINVLAPTNMPTPGAVIDVFNKGLVNADDLDAIMRVNGIHVNADSQYVPPRVWSAVVDAARPRIDPSTAAVWFRSGLCDITFFGSCCQYAGMSDSVEQQGILQSALPIDAATVVEQQRLGSIDATTAAEWIQLGGYAEDLRYNWLFDQTAVESPTEMARWARRGIVSWDRVTAHIDAGKHLELPVQQALLNSDLEPPQTVQILQLAQRGCVGPSDPVRTGLLAEYPFEWESWFHALSTGDSVDAVVPTALSASEWTKSRMDWAAHWRILQPAEVARWRDMSRAADAGWVNPTGQQLLSITDDDVRESGRQSALLPAYRDLEVAATYTHVGFRQLLQVAEFATVSHQQLVARTKLDGFSDADSELMAAALEQRVRLYHDPYVHSEDVKERQTVVGQTVDFARWGMLSDQDSKLRLLQLGYRDDEIDILVKDAKSASVEGGLHQSATELKRLAWSAGATAAKAKITQWRYGAITSGQLYDALALYGITQAEATWIMQAEAQEQLAANAKELYDFNHRQSLEAQSKVFAATIQSLEQGLIDGPTAIGNLVLAGDQPQHAAAVVSATLARIHARHVAAIVGSVRKAYESGAIDRGAAGSQLARVGIVATAVAEYLNTWDAEIGPNHHADTAGQIIGHVKTGLMQPAQARQRLSNLGWTGTDAAVELAAAEAALVKGKRAAAKAATQQRAAAAKSLMQAAKQLESERKATLKQAQQYVSQSTLKTWFQQKIIGEDYVREYFQAIGYPDAVVSTTIDSWRHPPKPVPPGTPSAITVAESVPGADADGA